MSDEKKKPLNKRDLLAAVSDKSGVSKADVNKVYDSLAEVIEDQLKTNGILILPNLLRVNVVTKPATKERNSINPFTKAPMVVPAKPERKTVKSAVAKQLNDAVVG